MIKSCIATCSYSGWRENALAQMVKDAEDAGYKFIELQPTHGIPGLIEKGKKGLTKLGNILSSTELVPIAVYGHGFGGHTEEEALLQAAKIEKFLEAAYYFQCRIYVSSDGDRTGAPWGIKNIITTLKSLEPKIEETGIRLALEPHINNNIEQISDYDKIFKEITNPKIGICIDTGHFYLAEVDVPKLIIKYPDRIFHVHIKDQKGFQSVPFGYGETDNLGCVKALKKIGYDGFLSIELEIHSKYKNDIDRYVREARTYVEKLID